MNQLITLNCIAFARIIKEIIEDSSVSTYRKFDVIWKNYTKCEFANNSYSDDFWFRLLYELIDDYSDALINNFSYVDNYSIDDLRNLLYSIINNILNNQLPTLDDDNHYFKVTLYSTYDEDFCKNKNDISYMTNIAFNCLKKLNITDYKIEKNLKWNRIVINKSRSQAIKIKNKSIDVIYIKIFGVPIFDRIPLKRLYNELSLREFLEHAIKTRIVERKYAKKAKKPY